MVFSNPEKGIQKIMRNRCISNAVNPSPAAAVEVANEPRPALLFEDDPLSREVTRDMLEELGLTVLTASSGEEALASNSSAPAPSVLIVDINLGAGMDGLEFGSRARNRWPNVPIMYFSGRPLPPKRHHTLDQHEIFLMKPVSLEALERAIARVVG